MKKMGAYCKAYPISRFREYAHWKEYSQNARAETQTVDGKEAQVIRTLKEDDFLYLQENYQVTDGIFLDEHVIFDDVTESWVTYCTNVLEFDPEGAVADPPVTVAETSASAGSGAPA